MAFLFKSSENPIPSRCETESGVINNLINQGWQIRPEEPSYNPNTDYIPQWNGQEWITGSISQEEIRFKEFENKVEQGYLVEPEGFYLAIGTSDLQSWNQLDAGLAKGEKLGILNSDIPISIVDKNGESHIITIGRWDQILLGLFLYYKEIWDEKLGL